MLSRYWPFVIFLRFKIVQGLKGMYSCLTQAGEDLSCTSFASQQRHLDALLGNSPLLLQMKLFAKHLVIADTICHAIHGNSLRCQPGSIMQGPNLAELVRDLSSPRALFGTMGLQPMTSPTINLWLMRISDGDISYDDFWCLDKFR